MEKKRFPKTLFPQLISIRDYFGGFGQKNLNKNPLPPKRKQLFKAVSTFYVTVIICKKLKNTSCFSSPENFSPFLPDVPFWSPWKHQKTFGSPWKHQKTFGSPWKHQNTFGFLMFSVGSKGNNEKKKVKNGSIWGLFWRISFLKTSK